MAPPATYTPAQVDRYLAHINFPRKNHPADPIALLTELMNRHRVRVPFESLDLHYTRARILVLDPEYLFRKVVERGRGGYCMEVNTLFGAVMRGLGFRVMASGGRVFVNGSFTGLSHMVNIVTLGDKKYHVDVGYGAFGPAVPMPLEHNTEQQAMGPYRARLEYKNLPDHHSDPDQRLWVYSHTMEPSSNGDWAIGYVFTGIEFFPSDFEVMNYETMSSPRSWFVKSVIVQRTVRDENSGATTGVVILVDNYVKIRMGEKSEVVATLKTEEQRHEALAKYFGIELTDEEKSAIKGLPSELRGRP